MFRYRMFLPSATLSAASTNRVIAKSFSRHIFKTGFLVRKRVEESLQASASISGLWRFVIVRGIAKVESGHRNDDGIWGSLVKGLYSWR